MKEYLVIEVKYAWVKSKAEILYPKYTGFSKDVIEFTEEEKKELTEKLLNWMIKGPV